MALLATACLPADTDATLGSGDSLTGVVTRIRDGDTVEVDTPDGPITVRLAGINAPETTECFGRMATDYLENALGERRVTLERIGTDQFGRVLANVFTEGRDLGLDLVVEGLAIATSTGDDSRRAELVSAEESAYAGDLGLWGPEACGPGEPHSLVFDTERSVPDPPGPDESSPADELVVIVNEGITSVSLDGWTLRDESSLHRLEFGADVTLDPGARLVVTSADPRWEPGQRPVWNNNGDMALLQDPLGNVIGRWRY